MLTPTGKSKTPLQRQFSAAVQYDRLVQLIDDLFRKTDFKTEEESIEPENAKTIRESFESFMDQAGLGLARHSFAELLEEKSGLFEFRDDGKTPNYFHELRECLQILALIRNKKLSMKAIRESDGLDVLIASTLRHDSFEDHGKTKDDLTQSILDKVKSLHPDKQITRKFLLQVGGQAEKTANIVDILSRKIAKRDENQFVIRNPDNGKLIKIDRYDGDLATYLNRQLEHPFPSLVKNIDAVEGMSTRILLDTFRREPSKKFSVADNARYAAERRQLFGNYNFLDDAIVKYPKFKDAFRCVDHMLGVNLVILETTNYYYQNEGQNPARARPVNIGKYIDPARDGYEGMPIWARPDFIMIGRLEKVAEEDKRMRALLTHAFYPAIKPLVGERAPAWLKSGQNSASTSEWTPSNS